VLAGQQAKKSWTILVNSLFRKGQETRDKILKSRTVQDVLGQLAPMAD